MEKQKPNEVRKEKLSGGMKKEKEVREWQGPHAGVQGAYFGDATGLAGPA